MNCESCTPSCAIPICSRSEVVIGTATPSTQYKVEFYDAAVEFTQALFATSDEDGFLTADLSDFKVTTERTYQLRLYTASCMPVNFERDEVTGTCFSVQFSDVKDLTPYA